jgi:hypothetical protein
VVWTTRFSGEGGLILGVDGRMLFDLDGCPFMAMKPTAQRAGKAPDPVVVDPKHYTVEVENEIFHVHWPP